MSIAQEAEIQSHNFSSLNLNEVRFALRQQVARNCRRSKISLEEATADLHDPALLESETESEEAEYSRPERAFITGRLSQNLGPIPELKEEKQETKEEPDSSHGSQGEEYSYYSETETEAAAPAASSSSAPAEASSAPAEARTASAAKSSSVRRTEASSATAEASSATAEAKERQDRIREAVSVAAAASGAKVTLLPPWRQKRAPTPPPPRVRLTPNSESPPTETPSQPSSASAPLKSLRDFKPCELTREELQAARAAETPQERRDRCKRSYRHYVTGDSLSGSDLERERAFHEDHVRRPRYRTVAGLERDSHGRPLSPATGRVLDSGVDYNTPQLQARLDEEARQLEVERNRAKKKAQKRKR